MGVAENGEPARLKRGRQFGGADHVLLALFGQAIHQVEIDRRKAAVAQQSHRLRHRFERLHAADQLLHMRIEILHAETDARNAPGGQRIDQIGVDITRVEFDRDFRAGRESEAAAQGVQQAEQAGASQHGGRAAAPMGVNDGARRGRARDEIDLAEKGFGIGVERPGLTRRLGVAAAIGAKLAAIGHVQIE